ncbi:MAG: hypothetical protein MMC23_001271 [Stictis urceolatum]|nr:hypothetical protein [Stictis urceolata]
MDASSDTSRGHPIPPAGLTVVVNPQRPSLDLIFVHGFTGHPERTWTHKRGDAKQRTHNDNEHESTEPPSKMRKLNPFFKSHHQDLHTAIYWPRDLIPLTCPDTRVLTYGYDTHIRHKLGPPMNRNTVYDIAWDFLVALEAERRAEPLRPVLFIVHSLGGIIVKEMLRRSSGCRRGQAHLQSIFDSTIGIIFFGTPHGGADPRNILHHIAERAIRATGFSVNEQIVNTLLPSAERLRELRDEFGPMAQEQDWTIHSFQEQLGVTILGGQKVVEDMSSCLNLPAIEVCEHIGRNHMEMCRFTGPDDVEYAKVASALCRMTSSISAQLRRQERPSLSAEEKQLLLDSLRFEQIDSRQMTIKNAHAKTCKWLSKKSEYLDWLDAAKMGEHLGFLWIKGKPGAGKSTIMKFALNNARKKLKDSTVISFFFNARGENLEKSTLGTYRSLLLQLLERIPTLESVFDSLSLSTRSISASYQWSVESLKALLEQVIQRLGESSVVCFIDALDECDELQIRDMVSFFEHIGELAPSSSTKFRVCFSSRHYPYITVKKGLSLVLEGQEGHNQDIINYLDSEMKIGHSKVALQIRTELQEKASGVFMWVVLVVGILNKEHDRGRIHALQRRLRDIPSDLHELFRDILTRDSQNREELVLCIQWVLFARQPLRPEQLYFAVLSGVEPEVVLRWNPDEITIHIIKRFILDSSKGLVEISKTSKVQFIHESVNDFLKENGLDSISHDLRDNFKGQSHERLKRCCLNYMNIDVFSHLQLSTYPPKASTEEASVLRKSATDGFPFLEYAIRHVLYHADRAEGYGISQVQFIQNFERFQRTNWIKLDNLFEKFEIRKHTQNATFLYILAEANMSNLIEIHPSALSFLEVEDERYGLPLFASLAASSRDAVRAFLKVCVANQSPSSQLYELCSQPFQDGRRPVNFGRDFKFSKRRTILEYLAELGDETILTLLLKTGKVEVDSKDKQGRTPLLWAAQNRYEAVVKLLLETGKVEVDSKDDAGRTPLWWAAQKGYKAVVKLLLETGKVEVDSKDNDGLTPLWWAALNGHEAVVKLLLETGKVEVDSKDNNGWTPLLCAALNGLEAVVKLLLETGKVEVDSKDDAGRTPLLCAALNGREAVVKLLLETGKVEVDSKDDAGLTPLLCAALNGREAVVKLLLETGKVEVDSKDNDGRTPLLWAAQKGYKAVVKLLLETGKVEVDSKNNAGRTPLLWAAQNGREAVVKLLLETGKVEVDSKDDTGKTLLSWAAQNGLEAVVKLLLETGKVEVDSKDNSGLTPLWWAARHGHKAVVKLLLDTGKVEVVDCF